MKFDSRTGKYYYINHYTKTTSWEDPRERYKEIGKPTGKDNKENEVQANTFSYFQKSTNSSWRWCLSQTYKWQACEGSLRPNSQASGLDLATSLAQAVESTTELQVQALAELSLRRWEQEATLLCTSPLDLLPGSNLTHYSHMSLHSV